MSLLIKLLLIVSSEKFEAMLSLSCFKYIDNIHVEKYVEN